MNATAQRTHATRSDELDSRVETLEQLVLQMSKNCDWLKQQVDVANFRVNEEAVLLDQYRCMSFRARLRWLFLGR